MNFFQLVSAVGFPLLMVAGGIVAWRMAKRDNTVQKDESAWRDDSLDDWRRERDAQAEQERLERLERPATAETSLHEGSGGDGTETKRQQRIGG